ncbi:hypothetical protein [Candidatus Palauibacter sp.]|uniref:hypothetical protein n=1 Tax=Candidatus Palauibacter sp. TaxID=3101350 RepID=UPI003B016D09
MTHNIVGILSDFATNVTRYYNIDSITGGLHERAYDPIVTWHRDVSTLVLNKHITSAQKSKIEELAVGLGKPLDPFTFVALSGEDRTPITDIVTATTRADLMKIERPHTRMYTLQICRFIASVMAAISDRARDTIASTAPIAVPRTLAIPYMREIFAIYFNDDRYFRTKKVWSIYF